MRKFLLVLSIVALALCVFYSEALAKGKGSEKARKAQRVDRNKDGILDTQKQRQAKQKLERKQKKANNWWRKRAAWKEMTRQRIDMNGDGVISPKERRLSWRHARSRVNTKLEKQYDANNDGWLDPDETKSLLQARRELLKTKGKAKVDSQVEAGYDRDENGIIDAREAAAMMEDI